MFRYSFFFRGKGQNLKNFSNKNDFIQTNFAQIGSMKFLYRKYLQDVAILLLKFPLGGNPNEKRTNQRPPIETAVSPYRNFPVSRPRGRLPAGSALKPAYFPRLKCKIKKNNKKKKTARNKCVLLRDMSWQLLLSARNTRKKTVY